MTVRKVAIAAALLAAFVLRTAPLGASDPIGIYCVVQKVVMEPDECAPTRVQVWGAFSFADPRTGGYTDVSAGYLYLSVPKDTSAAQIQSNKLATAEWTDLKAVAGTGEVVGFGARRGLSGVSARVRAATEKPADPDPYAPINIGVVKLRNNQWAVGAWYTDLAAALKKAASGR